VPRNADKALNAIRQSNGITINVSDDEILSAMRLLGKTSGVFGEPAGVAGTAGLVKAVAKGLIPEDALVVSIVTGNGLKDVASAQIAAGIGGASSGATSSGGGLESSLIHIEPDIDLLTKEFTKRNIRC